MWVPRASLAAPCWSGQGRQQRVDSVWDPRAAELRCAEQLPLRSRAVGPLRLSTGLGCPNTRAGDAALPGAPEGAAHQHQVSGLSPAGLRCAPEAFVSCLLLPWHVLLAGSLMPRLAHALVLSLAGRV